MNTHPAPPLFAILATFLVAAFAPAEEFRQPLDRNLAVNLDPTELASRPSSRFVQGSDGNFYGTRLVGGAFGFGTIFRVTPAGALTTLVDFTGNRRGDKGKYPYAALVLGGDGNFYGTTYKGGKDDLGTVFKVTPDGELTTLVEFTGNGSSNKGAFPFAALVQGSDGNFYGSTESGGPGYDPSNGQYGHGTVFQVTPAGELTTLVEFTNNETSNKGRDPIAALVQGGDGNLYGMTYQGGENDYGTVFRMTSAGALTTLVEFGVRNRNLGSYPSGGLVLGSDGNFYGTTLRGGPNVGGTVFRMTPAGVLTTLVGFPGNGINHEGSLPSAELVQGGDGNFYGTTIKGGASNFGTVFQMTPAGALTTLVEFTGNGKYPVAGLVQGGDGNFYGTILGSRINPNAINWYGDLGTIVKMTPAGELTPLVEFTDNRSSHPSGGLVQGGDGNFYGTTERGGASDCGTVFRMTPAGELTTLVEFTHNGTINEGAGPRGLVQGSDGNFYGTTSSGGGGVQGCGTVFRMTPAGELTTLVEFIFGRGGMGPTGGLVQGGDGSFYGTTIGGGAQRCGTVFRMTPTGALTTLVEFTGNGASNRGREPFAGLVQGGDGNFYGMTASGGAGYDPQNGKDGYGTVFKMTPAGELTTLVEFTASGSSRRGFWGTTGGLVQGSDGNFYGTTPESGAHGCGSVFKLTPAGKLTTLIDFTDDASGGMGREPSGGLVQGNDGNFYGTTFEGGAGNFGTVFKMSPAGRRTTLAEFGGAGIENGSSNNGSHPSGGLVEGSDGNFYGTTESGTAFRVTPAGKLTTLAEFAIKGGGGKWRRDSTDPLPPAVPATSPQKEGARPPEDPQKRRGIQKRIRPENAAPGKPGH